MKTLSIVSVSTLLATALVGCTMFKTPSKNGDYKVEPADQVRFDDDYKHCGDRAALDGMEGEGNLYGAEVRLGAINRCLEAKGWKR